MKNLLFIIFLFIAPLSLLVERPQLSSAERQSTLVATEGAEAVDSVLLIGLIAGLTCLAFAIKAGAHIHHYCAKYTDLHPHH